MQIQNCCWCIAFVVYARSCGRREPCVQGVGMCMHPLCTFCDMYICMYVYARTQIDLGRCSCLGRSCGTGVADERACLRVVHMS